MTQTSTRNTGLLFGTDGIRGLAGKFPLVPEFIERLGYTTALCLLKARPKGIKSHVILVRDTRSSSAWISRVLAKGLKQGGINVCDAGVLTTPSLAYLVPRQKALGGAVISASHNPAPYNGIKFFSWEGEKLPGPLEKEIESLVQNCVLPPGAKKKQKLGAVIRWKKGSSEYQKFLLSTLPKGFSLKGFKIVVDCSNGAAWRVAPGLLKRLGAGIVLLGSSPNGENINHHVGAVHPEAMAKMTAREGANLGISFDGDGDRAIFSDERGEVMDGDHIVVAAASYLKALNRLSVQTVVATVMANFGFFQAMKQLGIRVITVPVGDRFVMEGLKESKAILGGEPSGHIIFREYLPTGDGILTALQVLVMMRHTRRNLSDLCASMVKYPQVLINLPVRQKIPIEDVSELAEAIRRAQETLEDDGRVLVRYSGTEPLLRIMVEGREMEQTRQLAQMIEREARQSLNGSPRR